MSGSKIWKCRKKDKEFVIFTDLVYACTMVLVHILDIFAANQPYINFILKVLKL